MVFLNAPICHRCDLQSERGGDAMDVIWRDLDTARIPINISNNISNNISTYPITPHSLSAVFIQHLLVCFQSNFAALHASSVMTTLLLQRTRQRNVVVINKSTVTVSVIVIGAAHLESRTSGARQQYWIHHSHLDSLHAPIHIHIHGLYVMLTFKKRALNH